MSNLVGGCTLGQNLFQIPLWKMQFIVIPCASAKLKWGCTGFILSVYPSYPLAMELLQSFTKPSICDNAVNFTVVVVLWTELCPHCIFQTSSQILLDIYRSYWPTLEELHIEYRQVSNIRRTKSQHLEDSRIVFRLSLPNPLKPDVKSRMKM